MTNEKAHPETKDFWEEAYGPPEFHVNLKTAAQHVLLVHDTVGDDAEGALEEALEELRDAVDHS